MNCSKAFRSILFPVDFSEMSNVTASHVKGVTEATGAELTLLHVIPWLSAWYGVTELRPAVPGDPDFRDMQEKGSAALEKFQKKHFANIRCSATVRSGAVAETITDTATEIGAGLIMMPTRGLGRTRPFLIGSTTAKVLHDASCAIWTSPHLKKMAPFAPYKHILCTVDRDDVPEGYLEEVAHLTSSFGCALTFVSAIPSHIGGYGEEHPIRSLALEFPQAHIHEAPTPGECTSVTGTGSVAEVVREIAEIQKVDLVIANRGHLQHPFGKFRSHIYEIVLASPCPVISLSISSAPASKNTLSRTSLASEQNDARCAETRTNEDSEVRRQAITRA